MNGQVLPPRLYLREFTLSFVPLALVLGLLLGGYQYITVQNARDTLLIKEEARLSLAKGEVGRTFRVIVTDLMVLSESENLIRFLRKRESLANWTFLAREFAVFSRQKGFYDQIRFIDETGRELLRVNHNGGDPMIVPRFQLQSKDRRYYTPVSLKLERGQIFASKVDLNIDRGEIELPQKPTIRFTTPVFDSRGNRQGFIALNYYAEDLINRLNRILNDGVGSALIVDQMGRRLNPYGNDDWSFLIDGSRSFADDYPDIWGILSRTDKARLERPGGYLSFTTSFPLLEAFGDFANNKHGGPAALRAFEGDSYAWKIAIEISEGELRSHYPFSRFSLIFLYAGILLFAAGGSWFLAVNRLKKRKAEATLWRLAIHDALTGVFNRHYFFEYGERLFSQALRYRRPFSLIILDADFFKTINDTYGHDIGDIALIHITEICKAHVREADILARHGGEEFALLLPETPIEGAYQLAERIREAIAVNSVESDRGKVRVTVSLGVATIDDQTKNLTELIRKADLALYRAKEMGRNRSEASPIAFSSGSFG